MTMKIITYRHGKEGIIAELMMTKENIEKGMKDKVEVRIGLVGEENSGKSTFVRNFLK